MFTLRFSRTRMLIRTNGDVHTISDALDTHAIAGLIGAECLDTVMLADRVHVMVLDDNGYAKNLPVNELATQLYHDVCRPGTTHAILGDVVIIPDC